MLDDLAMIHERDSEDALGVVEKQFEQLTHDFELPADVAFHDIQNVVHAGMGGSALPGLLAQSWPDISVPYIIVRNYDLPSWVNDKTLVICDSVSGNTEETLSALEQARAKGAQVAIITQGGKLQEQAQANKLPCLILPQVSQPRYAVLANFRAVLTLLVKAGLAPASTLDELKATSQFLQASTAKWRADVPTKDNQAKQIAQELMGKSIVVYSGPKLFPAAYKWKISFNENAKHIAWVNQLPEFNHNEFIGWSKQPVDKPYMVIDLRSPLEHPRVQKRFEVTAQLLSGQRPDPIVVTIEGQTLLEQLLWGSAFGDFVSIYLALLNGLNPSPVDLVEKFKKSLG